MCRTASLTSWLPDDARQPRCGHGWSLWAHSSRALSLQATSFWGDFRWGYFPREQLPTAIPPGQFPPGQFPSWHFPLNQIWPEQFPPAKFPWGQFRLPRRTALLFGLGGVLAGCGFRPVYMPTGNDPGPASGLAEIEVKPIYERPGQILRQALLGRLGIEPGTPRKFDLAVNFWIAGEPRASLNFTQPTRIRLVAYTTWTLLSRDSKPIKLTEGADSLVDGFDVFDSQYFALDLANEAVQRRLAEAMADRIALRLAMWFHEHPTAIG